MKPVLSLFFALILTTLGAQTATGPHHYALFFAVSAYGEGWPVLSNPIRDAQLIGKMLRSDFGFEVEVVENPDKRVVLDKISAYRNKKYGPEDQLFIFFSGHGVFDAKQFQEGYFAPHDALVEDALYDSYLPYNRLRNWINAIPCPHILTAFDACQSGTFDEKMALGQAPINTLTQNWQIQDTSMVHELLKRRSRLFITSVSLGYAPDGNPNSNSPFALALWQALGFKGSDGVITFAELKEALPFEVKESHYGSFGDHEEGGEFLFLGTRQYNRSGRSGRTHLSDATYGENEEFRWDKKTLYDKRDGHSYPTVTIGNTVWMAGDLQYKARVFTQEDKKQLRVMYPYASGYEAFYKYSGFIYSFDDAQSACPKGWHLPTVEDFKTAIRQMGGFVSPKNETDEYTSKKLCKDELNLISDQSHYNGNQYWTSQMYGGLPTVYGFNHHWGNSEYCGYGVERISTRLQKCRCVRSVTPLDTITEGLEPTLAPLAVLLLSAPSPAGDALAEHLEKNRGFQVLKIERPSFETITQWFQKNLQKTKYAAASQLILYVEGHGGFDPAIEDAFFIPSQTKPGQIPDTIYLDEWQQMADRLPFGQILLLNQLDFDDQSLSRMSKMSSDRPVFQADNPEQGAAVRGKPENPFSQNEQQKLLNAWIDQLSQARRTRVSITAILPAQTGNTGLASRLLAIFEHQPPDKILDWNTLYDSLQARMNLLPRQPFGRHQAYSNLLFFGSPAAAEKAHAAYGPKKPLTSGNQGIDFGSYLQFGDTLILDKRDSARYRIGILNGQTWTFENQRYPSEGSYCRDRYAKDCDVWGRYYTWPAASHACPSGWRLPESTDFEALKKLPFSTFKRFLQLAGAGCMNLDDQKFAPTGTLDAFYFRTQTGNAGLINFDSEKQTIDIQYEGVDRTLYKNYEGTTYKLNCHSIRCIKQ